jgi:hypothetical protein
VYGEQGLGDALHFVRYLPLLRHRSGASRILLEAHPKLARLFTQSGGWTAEIVPGHRSEESALPPFDCHVPLLSLPLALGRYEPMPMADAYLHADPVLRDEWRQRLGARSSLRVGLVWAGNPEHKLDSLRSIPPEKLLPLLHTPGGEFYSLQMGLPTGGSAQWAAAGLIDHTKHLADFADTAALLAELDLVISVDTATAHLAGALGRPVWVMLPFQAEWRWGSTGDRTPWYPTMRLFRQSDFGDWDGVVASVTLHLIHSLTVPTKSQNDDSRQAWSVD